MTYQQFRSSPTNVFSAAEDSLKRRVTRSDAFLLNPASGCQASLFDSTGRVLFAADAHRDNEKRFVRTHNETLSVPAMRVSNERCSPARVHS